MSIIMGGIAGLVLAASVSLFLAIGRFYWSADYAPGHGSMPSYSAGSVEADGNGIFAPAILLLLTGIYLLKFAFNLWPDDFRRSKRRNKP